MLINIEEINSQQAKRETRASTLFNEFIPFRDQFVSSLEAFTQDAIERGIRGVEVCRGQRSTEYLETTLQLNDFDLAILATDETYPESWEDESLSAKIFIYHRGDQNHTPHLEIVFRESPDGPYRYEICWFTRKERKPVCGARVVSHVSGREAADLVIDHFFRLKKIWAEKPTLGAMYKGQQEKRPVGFTYEEPHTTRSTLA
jgi:hypothetical protein